MWNSAPVWERSPRYRCHSDRRFYPSRPAHPRSKVFFAKLVAIKIAAAIDKNFGRRVHTVNQVVAPLILRPDAMRRGRTQDGDAPAGKTFGSNSATNRSARGFGANSSRASTPRRRRSRDERGRCGPSHPRSRWRSGTRRHLRDAVREAEVDAARIRITAPSAMSGAQAMENSGRLRTAIRARCIQPRPRNASAKRR